MRRKGLDAKRNKGGGKEKEKEKKVTHRHLVDDGAQQDAVLQPDVEVQVARLAGRAAHLLV